ncbi:MAG: hypothetical protein ACLUNQ_04285 [Oscillospiraceae bacterium]
MQFAYLGNFYAQRVLGVDEAPRGPAEHRRRGQQGHRPAKADAGPAASGRRSEGDLHFIGNIEAKEAIKGGCDVIVTDGFSGNIMLKSIEGVGSFAGSALKTMFKKNLLTKLAALLVMPGLNDFKAQAGPQQGGRHRLHRHLQARHQGPRRAPTPRPSRTPSGQAIQVAGQRHYRGYCGEYRQDAAFRTHKYQKKGIDTAYADCRILFEDNKQEGGISP